MMLLTKAKQLVSYVFAHPLVGEMAIKGDKLSSNQTDHGMTHFLEVVKIARQLALMINDRKPGTLSDWEVDVVIPLAALLHDIGRAVNVDDHASAGAKWSRDFLRTLTLPGDDESLPRETVNRICKIIACHRSNIVLRRPFDDACWAVVVLADKFAGDEERVRPGRAMILAALTSFRLSFIPLRRGGIHDRVNFAIKNVEPTLPDDKLVLQLKIDPRVCRGRLILDTYSDRYVACHRAAEYLGLKFRFEVIAQPVYGTIARLRAALGVARLSWVERYAYRKDAGKWELCCA
jgi:hypothetical protein